MALPSPSASLLNELKKAVQEYEQASKIATSSQYSPESQTLLGMAEQLVASLKPVEERVWAFLFQPSALACANIAWGCGLLAAWPKIEMSSQELASSSKADQKLVVRLMRALVLYGIFDEVTEETYAHNAFSQYLSSSLMRPYYQTLGANQLNGVAKLPDYIASISYRNPGDEPSDKTYFQYANNTSLGFFEFMQKHPAQLAVFHATMEKGLAIERQWDPKGFASIYPFEDELVTPERHADDDVVLVDVGGGHGQVIKELRKNLPRLAGPMVLEDLPAVLDGLEALESVKAVPYNFFTDSQPIIGARAYLFRHILVDWSDADCRRILLNTIPALQRHRGSRILVADFVLPPIRPSAYKAMMDINIMRFEGTGRKERQWRELFASVGLEVKNIWRGNGADSVLEVVPREWLL